MIIQAVWILLQAEHELHICQRFVDEVSSQNACLSSRWRTVNEGRVCTCARVSIYSTVEFYEVD